VCIARFLPELISLFVNPPSLVRAELKRIQDSPQLDLKISSAYFLTGLTRGLGIEFIEKLQVQHYLIETKLERNEKLTGLVLIQAMLDVFGRMLEPYIVAIIQVLTVYFGDLDELIGRLSIKATKILMSNLSGYGVKVVLPFLLRGLEGQ